MIIIKNITHIILYYGTVDGTFTVEEKAAFNF